MNMVLLFFWLSCEDYGKPIEYGTLVKMESKPESCRNKIILLLLETGLEIKLTPKVAKLIPLLPITQNKNTIRSTYSEVSGI